MIAGKTWREIRGVAIAYLIILEMLAIPVLMLWPDIYADLQRSTLFRSLGVDWIKRLGSGISNRNEEVAYLNWCAVMLFFRSTNLVGTAAAVLIGTGLFARERESNTFEFLLARPVSRSSLLWQKFWPCALVVTLPIFIINATAIPWSWSLELDLPKWELFLASSHAAIFALTILSLTMFVSIFVRVPFVCHGNVSALCHRTRDLLRSAAFREERLESGCAEHGVVVAGGRRGIDPTADCQLLTGGRWRRIAPLLTCSPGGSKTPSPAAQRMHMSAQNTAPTRQARRSA